MQINRSRSERPISMLRATLNQELALAADRTTEALSP